MYENSFIIDAAQFCKAEFEYIECLKEAKINAVGINTGFNKKELNSTLDEWDKFYKSYPDLFILAKGYEDIKRAKKEKKPAIYFNIQNPSSINELDKLPILKEKGVFNVQLGFGKAGIFAPSCYAKDEGLNEKSKELILKLNELGILCDISFCAKKASFEAIEYSKRPLFMSHALPYDFHVSMRNKDKDLLKLLASKKGLIALSLFPPLLPNANKCSLHDFCEMVANLAQMIGTDSISIGSDMYEGQEDESFIELVSSLDFAELGEYESRFWPKSLEWFDLERGLYVLYENLFHFGFYEDEIKAILGENLASFLKKGLKPL